MNITVVGTGYVGLVSGACLADAGHQVTCVDLDPGRVAAVNGGRSPFHEPGMDELLARVAGRTLTATTDLGSAVRNAELTFLCVGTPLVEGRIGLDQVRAAAREVGEALRGSASAHVVAVRSTVVPGTTEEVVLPMLTEASGREPGQGIAVAMTPEFLTEGQALADFQRQDRLVIGTSDQWARLVLDQAFGPMPGVPRIYVSCREAELIKYASNALLATAISFANDLADLCEAVGDADVTRVMRGVHLSRYLTAQEPVPGGWTAPLAGFLEAGCGYGGSCLPKDTGAIVSHGRGVGAPLRVIEAAIATNQRRPAALLRLVRAGLGSLQGRRVTVLGLAFKPDTDDVRETPARPVVEGLLEEGAVVTVHDPVASAWAAALFGPGRVRATDNLSLALADAEAIVLVTRWPEYAGLSGRLADRPDHPLVVDGRRMLDPERFPPSRYVGIGR